MIGVIADDLTGAAELGAVGLRHGLRAEVVVNGSPGGESELVCMDTDSRSCPAAEAGQRAALAARGLRAAGAHWIYKKVDSVLRGQVVAELEAILKEIDLPRALLGPANPSLGRVIREGRYFIHGKPIHETEFARDPMHPRLCANVLELLGTGSALPLQMCRAAEPPPVFGIGILEAASVEDLQQWARTWAPDILPAGGAEFFAALLAARGYCSSAASDVSSATTTQADGKELFVCGSSSESSKRFVSAARENGIPVISLPMALAHGDQLTAETAGALAGEAVASFAAHRRVILNIGLPFIGDRAVAARLVPLLVRVAAAVLGQAPIGEVFVEGGATAVELARRMEWSRLTVCRELAPGVARLIVAGERPLKLTVKPGTYEWPGALTLRPDHAPS
jgi:uncharacterized protein YgbK (DUF1537 family)